MRKHYEFSKMRARRNPYVRRLKQSVTIRLDRETVIHFKSMAVKTGIPYQNLINLYLRDCALNRLQLSLEWLAEKEQTGSARHKDERHN
jgi:predicted DNA binding CopG/RHH family protein